MSKLKDRYPGVFSIATLNNIDGEDPTGRTRMTSHKNVTGETENVITSQLLCLTYLFDILQTEVIVIVDHLTMEGIEAVTIIKHQQKLHLPLSQLYNLKLIDTRNTHPQLVQSLLYYYVFRNNSSFQAECSLLLYISAGLRELTRNMKYFVFTFTSLQVLILVSQEPSSQRIHKRKMLIITFNVSQVTNSEDMPFT